MDRRISCGYRHLFNLSYFNLSYIVPSKGFTLPEALTTLSVVSILGLGVIPGINHMVLDNRLITATNEFIAHLHLTRSEAIKRGHKVIMCPSSDGETCSKSSEWQSGWMIFQELNHNNQPDPGERVIQSHEGVKGLTIRSGVRRQRVKYSAMGHSYGSNTTFVFCDNRGNSMAQAIILSPTGRPRSSDTRPDNKPLKCG